MPLEMLLSKFSNKLQNTKNFRDEAASKLSQEFTSEFEQIQQRLQNGELSLESQTAPDREPIRHLLYGSPEAVRRTILLLHQLGYAEPGLWSRLQPTSTPGQVMSVLVRYLRLE